MNQWIQSFEVPSSSGRGTYRVSQDRNGQFGCSCPHWKYRHQPCKHIETIKNQVRAGHAPILHDIPTCIPANVRSVQRRDAESLLVPLIPLNHPQFLATVVVDLLLHGIPFQNIRSQYHLPAKTGRQDYVDQVLRHGRHTYGPLDPSRQDRAIDVSYTWQLPVPLLPGETIEDYHYRTSYPLDLVTLAYTRLPTAPTVSPTYSASKIDPPMTPARKSWKRRIILAP